MTKVEQLKQEAGIRACDFVKSGMLIGLGTGSTVKFTIIELARRIKEEGLDIKGVPTSVATRDLAISLGIELVDLDEIDGLDLVIDGADEFDPNFQLIKGGGAALLREKIVAQASQKMIVVADDRKRVETLGEFPLPIEITEFCALTTCKQISNLLDCEVKVRMDGSNPIFTDNGNLIVDAMTGPNISEPISTEASLLQLAGVVQVGLFNNMCNVVVLASKEGILVLEK